MASVVRRGGPRYMMTKFWHAAEECLASVMSAKPAQAVGTSSNGVGQAPTQLDVLMTALAKFKESYNQRLTTVMYLTGPAMAPALNKAATTDKDAYEKLVVRQIPRPSSRTLFQGDVVAFHSPLAPAKDEASVMVRRIAAMEGEELELASEAAGGSDEDELLEVPKGHCWVLADNPDLNPPKVIDSRTFGYIPMSNIIGRVIYHGTSPSNAKAVLNSPIAFELDLPVIEAEVDADVVFKEGEDK